MLAPQGGGEALGSEACSEQYEQSSNSEEGEEGGWAENEGFDEDDPRWLYSRPVSELQGYCDEAHHPSCR